MKIQLYAILCFIMTALGGASTTGHVRRRLSPPLICRLVLVDSLDDPHLPAEEQVEQEEEYKCLLNNSAMSYKLDLPSGFLDEHPHFESGRARVSITNASPVWDPSSMMPPSISLSPDSTFTMLDDNDDDDHGRRLTTFAHRSHGNKTVLILRITAPDHEVEVSGELLSHVTLNTTNWSVASQYTACSYGKFNLLPAEGPGVVNGVLELNVSFTVRHADPEYLEPLVAQQAEAALGLADGSLDDTYDFILFVFPFGTRRNGCCERWYGFAPIGGQRSFYNDEAGAWPSVVGHELGHSLGLYHSGQDGNPYGDKTGLMGASHSGHKLSKKCFNGAKYFYLGWYSDLHAVVNITEGPWTGRLAAINEFNVAGPYEYSVVNVGDLYLIFNRQRRFNLHTSEETNRITIVQSPSPNEKSWLVGDVSNINKGTDPRFPNFFRMENFQNTGHALEIRACGDQEFNYDDNISDWMQIGVHLDGLQTPGCSAPLRARQTNPPSPMPSVAPSVSIAPTSMPTSAPSSSPSVSPSIAPSSAPTISTETVTCLGIDQPGLVPVSYHMGNQTCAWIAQHKGWKTFLCREGFEAFEQCQATCDSCNVQVSSSNSSCEDSAKMFYVNPTMGNRRCIWFGMFLKRSPQWKERFCARNQPAYHHCPETCGKCIDTCEDQADKEFYVNRHFGRRNCAWLADKPMVQASLCKEGHDAYEYCSETCNSCP